jgi:predicted metal-binding protein
MAMLRSYRQILLLQAHDARKLSRAVLAIERVAFLDGHYFAFALRACNLCRVCSVQKGGPCPSPEKVRPCDQAFGIDVYKTVKKFGLPCEVLQSKKAKQNRYGFVLVE